MGFTQAVSTTRTPIMLHGKWEKNAKGERVLVFDPIPETVIKKRVYVSEPRLDKEGKEVSKGGNECWPLAFAPMSHPDLGQIFLSGGRGGAITAIAKYAAQD